MVLFFSDYIYTRGGEDEIVFNLAGLIPLGVLGLGAGAFVPAALALMADSSKACSYGATMGLYSFALGFGAFIAESIGLGIIIASGGDDAPTWLLYFAAALIALAVILMTIFFISGFVRNLMRRRRRIPDDGC